MRKTLIFLKSSTKLAGVVTTWIVTFFVSLNKFKIYSHFYVSMWEVFLWFPYLIFVEGRACCHALLWDTFAQACLLVLESYQWKTRRLDRSLAGCIIPGYNCAIISNGVFSLKCGIDFVLLWNISIHKKPLHQYLCTEKSFLHCKGYTLLTACALAFGGLFENGCFSIPEKWWLSSCHSQVRSL